MIETKLIESEINGIKTYKTMVPVDQLKEDTNNPRDISDAKLNDLVDFLSKYGELKPVLVDARPDKEGQLIGGNMRLKAYKILGWSEIWAEFRNPGNDAEAFSIATTDNMEFGYYVENKLKTLLDKYKDEIDLPKLGVQLQPPPSLEELLKQFSGEKQNKPMTFELLIKCSSLEELNANMAKLSELGIKAKKRGK
jgi:hypothetical protein